MDEEKREYVLNWTTREGEWNRLSFQWHMDAAQRAQELLEGHKSGREPLLSLQIITYETFI